MDGIEAAGEIGSVTGPAVRPVDAESAPLCSIVIPTYNGRGLLDRCLASIARHRPAEGGPSIEVIVADDASTDETAEWLTQVHPDVRLVRLAQNGGFCAACNAGIAVARGRYIQVLNNDTEVTGGWVQSGLAPFADETVGSVAPLVLVRSQPGRVDSAGDSYALAGWPAKRGHGQPAEVFASRTFEDVFGASGSSAFYRAEALRQVGGFDPLFGSYYEDIDLAFRLRWAGYRCVFASGCVIHHDVSATYDHKSPALQRRMARNAEIVFWANLQLGLLAAGSCPLLGGCSALAQYVPRHAAGLWLWHTCGRLNWHGRLRRSCAQRVRRASAGALRRARLALRMARCGRGPIDRGCACRVAGKWDSVPCSA